MASWTQDAGTTSHTMIVPLVIEFWISKNDPEGILFSDIFLFFFVQAV